MGVASTPPTGTEVELTKAQDFDPEGGGGEHSDEVGLAIDGNPNTVWPTETYTAGPDLSLSGKSGVGLIVEAADPVTGQSLRSAPGRAAGTRPIYASDSGPPTDLAGWGKPVGSITNADQSQVIDLTVPSPARYYLIWFTKLADANGEGRVEVSDVTLNAAT